MLKPKKLKKSHFAFIIITSIILLLVISLTIGSIRTSGSTSASPTKAVPIKTNDNNDNFKQMSAGQDISYKGQNLSYSSPHRSDNYITIIINLFNPHDESSETVHAKPVHTSVDQQNSLAYPDKQAIVNSASVSEKGYIPGTVTVQMPGNATQQVFPIMYVGPNAGGLVGDNRTGSYNASLSFGLANTSNGTQGSLVLLNGISPGASNGSEATYFTINSTININGTNILLTSDNITTIDQFYTYNNSIMSGQTMWHQTQVSGNSVSLSVDVSWQSPQNDFRLIIYTPDRQTLGPYNDNSDGKMDDQIYLNVTSPDGVPDGTWSYKLTDLGNAIKDEYSIRTWQQ